MQNVTVFVQCSGNVWVPSGMCTNCNACQAVIPAACFPSCSFLWAFSVACLVGMWVHFIPCIWWTCDWGDNDGEGVRGAIWFILWGVGTVVLLLLVRQPAIHILHRESLESGEKSQYITHNSDGDLLMGAIRAHVHGSG